MAFLWQMPVCDDGAMLNGNIAAGGLEPETSQVTSLTTDNIS